VPDRTPRLTAALHSADPWPPRARRLVSLPPLVLHRPRLASECIGSTASACKQTDDRTPSRQILFQAGTGLTLAPDQISIATKSWGSKVANFASDGRKRTYTFGEGWTTWPLYALGPFARGWAPARGILSAGMTAKRWTESRWGASRDGWEVAESLQRPQQEATKAAVIADPRAERRYDAATGMIEVAPGLFDFAIFDDLSEQEQRSVAEHWLERARLPAST
jgi:hypothetical protein